MIQVVRIQGESFNLGTGELIPKSLILSNGVRELFLPVDDSTAEEVLRMLVECAEVGEEVPSISGTVEPGVHKPVSPSAKVDSLHIELVDTPLSEAGETPAVDDKEDDDFEPGEEYNDPMTGIGSM
jgi:hypothetical protein